MTRNGFDYIWNHEHNTWVIFPHDYEEDRRDADDFLGALNKKLS